MAESEACYYSVLGLRKQGSATKIRDAYRKLGLKWHPDRWIKDPIVAGQAKRQFQQIQEAYTGKRKLYDAGTLSFVRDDDDEMDDNVEDIQGLLMDMIAEDEGIKFGFEWDTSQSAKKRLASPTYDA